MKNKRLTRSVAGFMLVSALLAGSPGCSVRKKRISESNGKREVVQLRTDSLLVTGRRKVDRQSVGYRQQIRLSPPDSAGRQYIQTITQALSATGYTETGHDTLTRQSVSRSLFRSDRQQQEMSVAKHTSVAWKWITGGLFILAISAFLLRRKG